MSASSLQMQRSIDPFVQLRQTRCTKIVATLGPGCIEKLPEMLLAGMNVARINCAHGDAAQHLHFAARLRAAESTLRSTLYKSKYGWRCMAALAFDIKGPEIRIGLFDPDGSGVSGTTEGGRSVSLIKGQHLSLRTEPTFQGKGDRHAVWISHAGLPETVRPGQPILIDDGSVHLEVVSVDARSIQCRVVEAAVLGERKNCNLPGMSVQLPPVTAKDRVDILVARQAGADFLFASFVQTADAVRELRSLAGPTMRIIAKIEDEAGLRNLGDILSISDGLMVARGDLGVQIPGERVVLAQKRIVAQANIVGKPVIVATQMLESMVHNARPTRAELNDVASAVLDGADAVMLSSETAKGAFALQAVDAMSRACQVAEMAYANRTFFTDLAALDETPLRLELDEAAQYRDQGGSSTFTDTECLASSAVHCAFEQNAAAIVVLGHNAARGAALLSKYRPGCPIFCFTSDDDVSRQLKVRRGVHTYMLAAGHVESFQDLKTTALCNLQAEGLVRKGDKVVLMYGQREWWRDHTDTFVSLASVEEPPENLAYR
jgi:pyruvate kinase